MQIYNYNKEKKEQIPFDVYFRFAIVGLILGVALIITGISLNALFKFIVRYWIWVLGILAVVFVIRKIFFKKREGYLGKK